MHRFIVSCGTAFGSVLAIVFMIAIVADWSFDFGFFLMMLGFPALAVAFLVIVAIKLVGAFRQARTIERRLGRIVPFLVVIIFGFATPAAAWPTLRAGQYAGAMTRLLVNWNTYEVAIALARAGRPVPKGYVVDQGPPVRMAFNQSGFLSSWSGIISDPTGEVAKAKGYTKKGKLTTPDSVVMLFGGTLVGCDPLIGDYYLCFFS